MAKPLKSQWEFGELFAPEALRKVLSVSELTLSIKKLLEREIGQIWVTGEITNLRVQSSGHVYFSIKDVVSQLNCVLFRGEAKAISRDVLRDGQKVILQGDLTVYEARGQYQLRVTSVELQGVGALQIAFEKLKQKLNAEGLFAAERKRPLPSYPQRIGLVTSPTGAAIRDVVHVIQRRQPGLQIVLVPCRVQGSRAGDEIADAIRILNKWAASEEERTKRCCLDLILITRGGGSLEDLWAFNEEVVARAVFDSKVPVVSAVGHEIDFTIADFVADLRAATPSVAAEIITEGVHASRQFIADTPLVLRQIVQARLEQAEEAFMQLSRRLSRTHPRRHLEEQFQRLDDNQERLLRAAKSTCRLHRTAWAGVCGRLARLRPAQFAQRRREALETLQGHLIERARQQLAEARSRLETARERLRLLSPTAILERGYSITLDAASGKVIHSQAEAAPGQRLLTRLKDGQVLSVVENAKPNQEGY